MRYTTVIFDLDGTLLDTLEDLADALNYALKKHEYPVRSLGEVRSFVGNGVQKLVERALPRGLENPDFDKVFADFKEYYAVHCEDKTDTYAGVTDLIGKLSDKGLKMAVVSNKLDGAVKQLCSARFGGKIECAIGEVEGIRRKPFPDMVEKALLLLGSTKEETVYVGDSEVDLQTAANSGLDCISVTWGFRDEDFLADFLKNKIICAQHQKTEHIFAKTPDEVYHIIVADKN